MKSSMFRLLTTGFSIIAIALFAGSVLAQGNGNGNGRGNGGGNGGGGSDPPPPPDVGVAYRPFWPALPATIAGNVNVRDFKYWVDAGGNEQVVAVGFYYEAGRPYSAFLYDHGGLIDPGQIERFWDLGEIGGPIPGWVPATHTESMIYSFNTSGRVAGVFRDPNNTAPPIPFYFDLSDQVIELKEIPIPVYAVGREGVGLHSRVNEIGDILISYGISPGYEAIVYNPDGNAGAGEHIRLLDSDGSPLQLGSRPQVLNSSRQVVGERFSGESVVRFPLGGVPSDYEEFADASHVRAMNESSEFGCRLPYDGNEIRATKIGEDVLWTAPVTSYPHDLNNSGDLLMEYSNTYGGDYYMLHEGDPNTAGDDLLLNIRSMLIEGTYPLGSFEEPMFGLGITKVSDRDTTGFGWLSGETIVDTNPDGTDQWAWFLLIPETLTQVPGVSLTPSSGLTTTEAGDQATFDIVLNAAPIADVTIGISSSDTTEGTADPASLTFTPSNWNSAQTVTVTGADDPDVDGNIAYTIVTAAATSNDPGYNGLDADDVSVTNLDNEQAPTVTYDSDVSQNDVDIPDQGTATSKITVPDAYQVADVNVTLTIDHARVQDLDVYLIGPDGTKVQLFTDVGGNGVNFSGTTLDDEAGTSITAGSAPFSGSFYPEGNLGAFDGKDTDGDWTLEVTDDKRNRTGTIRNWSITFETQ